LRFSIHDGRQISLSLALVFIYFFCSPLSAFSAEVAQKNLLGELFKGVRPVTGDQAQVIYYRAAGNPASGPAYVYLDQEFVTALLPGGYTSLCTRSGVHTMGAYLDEAPLYPGKNEDLYITTLKGGMTYYLKVREQGGTLPLVVGKSTAESELANVRLQIHLQSRASQIENCRHYGFIESPAAVDKIYVLDIDQLFAERNGSMQMNIAGLTYPLDDEASSQLLGQARANNLR